VIVGCNCLKKQTTDEKKLAKYTRTPARHVPLSNDNLLREAFSTHPLFSGRVFQEKKRKEYENKEKIIVNSSQKKR
jgi:hypothetical protein